MDFAGIIEALDVGVLVELPDGTILHANPRAVFLLGQAAAGRSANEPSWEMVRPDGTPLPIEERPSALARTRGSAVRDVVLGVRGADGGLRWLLVSATPVVEGGVVARVVVTLSDVSSEHRRLAESVQLYRSVIRSMAEGVAVHEASGAIRDANPAAERILGLSMAQLSGREAVDPRWRLTRPDGSALAPEEIPSEITARTGQPCERVTLGVHRPGGERAWLAVTTQPLGTALAGERVPVVATFADVSAERAAREDLERSRALLQRVTEHVPGMLFELERGGGGRPLRLRFVSARVRELFGVSPDDALRAPLALVRRVHVEDRRAFLRSLAAAVALEEAWQIEVRVRDAEDRWRWVRNHAVPEREGEVVVWGGVVLDVTEEHRLAEQVSVAQRREAVVAVTAGIAHNFNNSLAVLVPNLVEALERVYDPEVRQLLEDALTTARSSTQLVKQLMHITRTQERAERVPVELGALLREVAALSRTLFKGRVQLVEELPGAPVIVKGSAAQLHQLVLNLCINARDALVERDSGGRVELRLDVEGGRAVIAVRDNGGGMTEEVVKRLGEPFFTTKPPGKGTGLGLATAYATVRSMGGTIACESIVGEGTTFTIVLPLASSSSSGTHPAVAPSPAPRVAGAPRGRVLLVDDDALVRRAVGRLLAKDGWVVDEAREGGEALARVAERADYRAVVLDLNMEGVSGEAVLAELRRRRPSLPVVVLSGYVEAIERLKGAAAVLHKPATDRDLLEALARVTR
jgi:PAS domain S-box-containing protein